MRYLGATPVLIVMLSLAACAGNGEPAANATAAPTTIATSKTPLPPLGKADACIEFTKNSPTGAPEEPFSIALNQVLQSSGDSAKLKAATDQMVVALQGMRADMSAIAASATDAELKTAITQFVSQIEKAEVDLPGAATDMGEVLKVIETLDPEKIRSLCQK